MPKIITCPHCGKEMSREYSLREDWKRTSPLEKALGISILLLILTIAYFLASLIPE